MRFPPPPVEAWPSGVAAFGVEGARDALLALTEAELCWMRAARRARSAEAAAALLRVRRILAHDVRSPLGVVLGHGQLLEEGLMRDEEARASGRTLVRQAARLTQMTEEAALLATCAASPVLGVDAVDVSEAWASGPFTVQGKARAWVRPGALAELVNLVGASLAPATHARLTFTVAIRPSRVVGTLVAEAPLDGEPLSRARRALTVLGGTLTLLNPAALRLELPGDDGRLAVKLVGEDDALVNALRALGVRWVDPNAAADVALVLPGQMPEPDGLRRLHIGARAPAPSVPEGLPAEALLRVLRRVAEAPRAVCPFTGASRVASASATVELRFEGRSPLQNEECAAYVAEALETDGVGDTVFAVRGGLRVVGADVVSLRSWFDTRHASRVTETLPACGVRILAL